MVSVKVKLRKAAKNGNKGALVIQIISKRKVKLIKTDLKLYPHEWDAVNEQIYTNRDRKGRTIQLRNIRSKLNAELHRLDSIIQTLQTKGIDNVHEICYCFDHHCMSANILDFMDQRCSKMKLDGRYKSASLLETVKRSFETFLQISARPLLGIDAELMKQYEEYLFSNNLSPNSSSCYMRTLRSVYNKAVEEGLSSQKFPFRYVYTGIAKTRKLAINEQAIRQMMQLDFSSEPTLSLSRDLFMFSFYTRGMSFVDMANLTQQNLHQNYLSYKRSKSGAKISIKIEPCINHILKKYRRTSKHPFLLPIKTSSDSSYASPLRIHNKRLRRISQILRLEKPLSSYTARHSWATIALRNGVDLITISESMGHSSERTTRIYLDSLGQNMLDKANEAVIKLFI
jgi:site-specific recombinase XerD